MSRRKETLDLGIIATKEYLIHQLEGLVSIGILSRASLQELFDFSHQYLDNSNPPAPLDHQIPAQPDGKQLPFHRNSRTHRS